MVPNIVKPVLRSRYEAAGAKSEAVFVSGRFGVGGMFTWLLLHNLGPMTVSGREAKVNIANLLKAHGWQAYLC